MQHSPRANPWREDHRAGVAESLTKTCVSRESLASFVRFCAGPSGARRPEIGWDEEPVRAGFGSFGVDH